MRRKNTGGESKIRRNAQIQVCQDGKAKAWLKLNMGILKVKGKPVGPTLNESGAWWQGLWKRLRSSMPWSWLVRPHFRHPRPLRRVGRTEAILIYPERREDIVKVYFKIQANTTPWCLMGCTKRTKTKASAKDTLSCRPFPTMRWEGYLKH